MTRISNTKIDGPAIGLIISSVLPLATMLQWVTRQSAELENQLVSVERIEQYINLKPEEPNNSTSKIEKEADRNGKSF